MAGTMVTGALAGTFTCATVARSMTPNPSYKDTLPKFKAGLKWGAIGAAVGAAAGLAVAGTTGGAFILGTLGTLSTLALTTAYTEREVLNVRIGEEILVDDYVRLYGKKEAMVKIDEELHTRLGRMKAEMTGVPYDENGPKIRDRE